MNRMKQRKQRKRCSAEKAAMLLAAVSFSAALLSLPCGMLQSHAQTTQYEEYGDAAVRPVAMDWEDGYVTDGATGDRPGIIGDEHRTRTDRGEFSHRSDRVTGHDRVNREENRVNRHRYRTFRPGDDHAADRSTDRTAGRTTDRTAGRTTDRTAGRTTDRTTGRTTDRTTGRTTDRTTDHTTDRTTDRASDRTAKEGTDNAVGNRNEKHRARKERRGDYTDMAYGMPGSGGTPGGSGTASIPGGTAEEDLADGVAGGFGGMAPGNVYGTGTKDIGEAVALTDSIARSDSLVKSIWSFLIALAISAGFIGLGVLLLPKPDRSADRKK